MDKVNIVISSILGLVLIACSENNFEGEYIAKPAESKFGKMAENLAGRQKLSFHANGKVSFFMGERKLVVLKYEKNGDKITVFKTDDQTQTYTLEDDGGLFGGGSEFVKVSSNATDMDVREQSNSKTTSKDSTENLNLHTIKGSYVSKPDPNFNPEYATVTRLLFQSNNKLKVSVKYYDTGEFREQELSLNYNINGDKITSIAENGNELILSIQDDGSLLDSENTEFIKQE
tara:strand:+ start:2232 stop:2924 length:693 start_codon:yes stop_codon:yes gene_type:complete